MSKLFTKLVVLVLFVCLGLLGLYLLASSAQAREGEAASSVVGSAGAGARPALAGFNISVSSVVSSGFALPIQVTNAGDGSNRLFVVEQEGRIRIINSPVVTPFLDIRSLVRGPSEGGSEEGLLSVAFHPDYENNGYFYVYYNNTSSNIVIARYSVSANPNIADPNSALIILPIAHPTNSNHNGGQLMFGPLDGYLYAGTGDGGSGDDPNNNGQNKDTLLGKILRLNVTGATTYTIPPTNPYVGVSGDDRIWDIGLRNPWRFSFDRGDSSGSDKGDMYIGDVGQGKWEEISYQAAGTAGGVNFGWKVREGPCPRGQDLPCSPAPAPYTDPIAYYGRTLGNAVTGGFVYRGNLYPALQGYYFYADYGTGRIWSMTKTGPNTWSTPEQELDTSFNISAFGEDEQGEVYVVDYGGSIRRLADANGPSPLLTASKSPSSPGIDPGETLTYTIFIKNSAATTTTFFLKDQIPSGLSYVPGSLSATQGSVNDSLSPVLSWQGTLASPNEVTLTYQVTATGIITGLFANQAIITSTSTTPLTVTGYVFVPRPTPQYLPVIFK